MADWLTSAFGLGAPSSSKEDEAKNASSANGLADPEQRRAALDKSPVLAPNGAKARPKKSPAGAKAVSEAPKTGEAGNKAPGSQVKAEATSSAGASTSGVVSTPSPAKSAAVTSKKEPSSRDATANGVVSPVRSEKGGKDVAKKSDKPSPQKSEQAQVKKPEEKNEVASRKTQDTTTEITSRSSNDLDTIEKRKAAAAAAAASAGADSSKRAVAVLPNATNAASVTRAAAMRKIRVTEALPELVSQAQACLYEPAEFFVAWQGVLTIIYTGIPPSLCRLKAKMTEQFPGLPPENPGSLWPKTSLACLKDDKRLSPEQLQQLRDICSKVNFQLVYSPVIHVNSVSVVIYENCCLEKQLVSTHIQLQQPEDTSAVSEEQRSHVRKVADEFSPKNLQNYWFHASKDGNRSKHYRQSKAGATLVHFLGDEVPPSVATFQKLVEAAMPGMYDWFPHESLHITLRSLC